MNETVSDSGATWQVFPPGSRVTIDGSVADVYWQESRPREHLDLTGTESQDRLPAGCYQTSKGHLLGKKILSAFLFLPAFCEPPSLGTLAVGMAMTFR
jgi:hypothetical protein